MTQQTAEHAVERASVRFTFATTTGIVVSILSLSVSSVMFKYSADLWDNRLMISLILFGLGTIVGLVGTIATTIALRDNDTNIIYATIGGPGAVLLHISLAMVFQQSLPWWQWLAIAIIVFGAMMLHVDPKRLFPEV